MLTIVTSQKKREKNRDNPKAKREMLPEIPCVDFNLLLPLTNRKG